jgi:hypothetical protein
MSPIHFPQANVEFTAPADMEESQVATIPAHRGTIERGSIEGAPVIVTAWKPTREELQTLIQGGPVFVAFICDGLPPHLIGTTFDYVTHPA